MVATKELVWNYER